MSQKRISDFFKDPVGHGSTKRQNTTDVECVSIQVSLPALPSKDHPHCVLIMWPCSWISWKKNVVVRPFG
jgi:hypothetical protein